MQTARHLLLTLPCSLLRVRTSRLLLSCTGNTGDFKCVLLDFLSILDYTLGKSSALQSAVISHPTLSGQTLLHLATLTKFLSLIKFLVSHGINVDTHNKNGCTALFYTAVAWSSECAQVLIEGGAGTHLLCTAAHRQAIIPATILTAI